MPGLAALPNAACALSPPSTGRRAVAARRPASLPSRFGRPDAKRPEMAPQRLQKIESAPGNGAPLGPPTAGPAVFDHRWTGGMRVGRKWRRKGLENVAESAPGNGARRIRNRKSCQRVAILPNSWACRRRFDQTAPVAMGLPMASEWETSHTSQASRICYQRLR